jgi:hypothetical protein
MPSEYKSQDMNIITDNVHNLNENLQLNKSDVQRTKWEKLKMESENLKKAIQLDLKNN